MRNDVKPIVFPLLLCLVISPAAAAPGRGEGALYYARGHYWIELVLYDSKGAAYLPDTLETNRFIVERIDEEGESFKPSKVQGMRAESGDPFILITSGKLKGGRCYRVTFRNGDGPDTVVERICDPFYYEPGGVACAGREVFTRYIAAAFSRTGDVYALNKLGVEYDFTAEKSFVHFVIEPVFTLGEVNIKPYFEIEGSNYRYDNEYDRHIERRMSGLSLSGSLWAHELRFSADAQYHHERSEGWLPAEPFTMTKHHHRLMVTGRAGLDNIFDAVNSYCLSVFKGVDLALGYAWYTTDDTESWSASGWDHATPYVNGRFTWTFLYGFQFSYSYESFWPGEFDHRRAWFHSIRFRLLLRDVLERPERKSYHPDLEFRYDAGRRWPVFLDEKTLSLGFTFNLFPW
jgi:hypothetical protein